MGNIPNSYIFKIEILKRLIRYSKCILEVLGHVFSQPRHRLLQKCVSQALHDQIVSTKIIDFVFTIVYTKGLKNLLNSIPISAKEIRASFMT